MQLAEVHLRGRGTRANCTHAQLYLADFLEVRAAWRDAIEAAVSRLDRLQGWPALLQMAEVGLACHDLR